MFDVNNFMLSMFDVNNFMSSMWDVNNFMLSMFDVNNFMSDNRNMNTTAWPAAAAFIYKSRTLAAQFSKSVPAST